MMRIITAIHPAIIRKARHQARTGSHAAVPGTASRGASARRSAAGTGPETGASSWASAWFCPQVRQGEQGRKAVF